MFSLPELQPQVCPACLPQLASPLPAERCSLPCWAQCNYTSWVWCITFYHVQRTTGQSHISFTTLGLIDRETIAMSCHRNAIFITSSYFALDSITVNWIYFTLHILKIINQFNCSSRWKGLQTIKFPGNRVYIVLNSAVDRASFRNTCCVPY